MFFFSYQSRAAQIWPVFSAPRKIALDESKDKDTNDFDGRPWLRPPTTGTHLKPGTKRTKAPNLPFSAIEKWLLLGSVAQLGVTDCLARRSRSSAHAKEVHRRLKRSVFQTGDLWVEPASGARGEAVTDTHRSVTYDLLSLSLEEDKNVSLTLCLELRCQILMLKVTKVCKSPRRKDAKCRRSVGAPATFRTILSSKLLTENGAKVPLVSERRSFHTSTCAEVFDTSEKMVLFFAAASVEGPEHTARIGGLPLTALAAPTAMTADSPKAQYRITWNTVLFYVKMIMKQWNGFTFFFYRMCFQ